MRRPSGPRVLCSILLVLVFANLGPSSVARENPQTNCPYSEQEWLETTGYWQDQTTGSTVYENGRQVVILQEASVGNETVINEIAEQYRSQFDQQSVLISSHQAKVRFCEQP